MSDDRPRTSPCREHYHPRPTDEDDIWQLTFKDEQSGEHVHIVLPLEQLKEMDAGFTGHIT